MRPVEWSDMAVLLRSERGRAADYAAEFRAAGIPLVARQAGFFEVPVVADLRNLLRVLDNPLQDIPLLAVLRSPMVGLGDVDALVAIRMTGERRMDWWTRLVRFQKKGREAAVGLGVGMGEGWDRVDRFLRQHAAWRQVAIREGAAMALETALDATGYEGWAAGADDGGMAVANVRRFLEMARRFDRGSRGGLYRFLVWLENEEEEDRTEPSGGDAGSAVRLMTVHRSKGLEFPVVAVAGLGMRFQMRDLTMARVVRDDGYGLCPLVTGECGRRYPSLPLWVAQRRLRRELLGEELRLLYVSLTRAADHLVLVGSATEKAVMERWHEMGSRPASDQPLPVADIEAATSPMEWLGPILAVRAGSGWGVEDAGRGEGFDWKLWRELPRQPEVWESIGKTNAVVTGEDSWAYPHQAATAEPAKVTATGLRRRMAEDPDGIDIVRHLQRNRHGESDPRDGTAVERGVAHHRFMEGLRLDQAGNVEEIRGELDRMLKTGWMAVEEGALVDLEAVVRFWATELGVGIRARAGQVRREVPFTARLTGADLAALGFRVAEGLGLMEYVVAQGVVDLAVIGPDEIWILDFKTDRVGSGADIRSKAATYRSQLAVYAVALARIHGKPVTGRWLHFLATGDTIEV
jgi:ATP-dependent helicase/nuclease subunit A